MSDRPSTALAACQALADRVMACRARLSDDQVDLGELIGEVEGVGTAIGKLPPPTDAEEAALCLAILRGIEGDRRACLERLHDLRRQGEADAARDASAARQVRAYQQPPPAAGDARFVDRRR